MGKAISELDSFAGPVVDGTLIPVASSDTLKAATASQLKTYMNIPAAVTVDSTPTDGSSNAVSSNGVFDALAGKQATLVSGTSIKTINSTSLLGSGDISVSASPGGSTTQVQYNSAGAFAGASGITTTGTELTIDSGTQTTSKPVLDLSQTWNHASNTFYGQEISITDPLESGTDGRGTGSRALRVRYNTRHVFSVGVPIYGSTQIYIGAGGSYLKDENASGGLTICPSGGNRSIVHTDGVGVRDTGRFGFGSNDNPSVTGGGVCFARESDGVAQICSTRGTYRDLKLRNLIASGGVVTHASFTVATLPSASTSGAGAQAFVTDANATTARSTVAGGGSNKVNVFSDGTNWLIAA